MISKQLLLSVALLAGATVSVAQSAPYGIKKFDRKNPSNKIFKASVNPNSARVETTKDSTFYRPLARTLSYWYNGQYEASDSIRYGWHKNEGSDFEAGFDNTDAFKFTNYITNNIEFELLQNSVFYKNDNFSFLNLYYHDGSAYVMDDSISITYNNADQKTALHSTADENYIYRYDANGNLVSRTHYIDTTFMYLDSAVYNTNNQPVIKMQLDDNNHSIYEYTYDSNQKLTSYTYSTKNSNDSFQSTNVSTQVVINDLGNNVDSIYISEYNGAFISIAMNYKNSAHNTDSLFIFDNSDSTYKKYINVEYITPTQPSIGKIGNIGAGEYDLFLFNHIGNFIKSTVASNYDEATNDMYDPYKEEYSYDSNNNVINIKSLIANDNDTANWYENDDNFNINIYYEDVTVQVEDPTSIKKLDISAVSLYPNPSSNQINIATHEALIEQIQVYDAMGRLVLTKKLSTKTNETTLNVNYLSNGNYIINITTNKGAGVKKFTKN